MTAIVIDAALALAVLNAAAGAFGSLRWYRGEPSRAFWWLLRVAQFGGVALAAGVGLLAVAGRRSGDGLFYLYALLPVAVAFLAEQLRVASAQAVLDQRGLADASEVGRLPELDQRRLVLAIARREMGVMVLSTLVIVVLALRAAGTAHGF